MSINRDAIKQAADLKREVVPVPEWGGDITIREMTGVERDSFEKWIASHKSKGGDIDTAGMRVMLISLCAIDDAGERLFADSDKEWLNSKSAVVLQRLFDAASKINGLTKDEAEKAKTDFLPTQTTESGTESLGNGAVQ